MEEVIRVADEKNVGGMLLAFLAGSVVGAALGLLLAPLSGAETRQKVRATSLETIKSEHSGLLPLWGLSIFQSSGRDHQSVPTGHGLPVLRSLQRVQARQARSPAEDGKSFL